MSLPVKSPQPICLSDLSQIFFLENNAQSQVRGYQKEKDNVRFSLDKGLMIRLIIMDRC
jgi:hypothetical protein